MKQRIAQFAMCSTACDLARLLHVSAGEINFLLSRLEWNYCHRIRKKLDGGKRHLFVPSDPLKLLQQKVNEHILGKVQLLPCVYGGVKRKSVVGSASFHEGKDVVFAMDLEHCFPSIGVRRVKAIFQALRFGPEAVGILTKLTTWRNELPQGVPTSTALANLALTRVDVRIMGLQEHHKFDYTRWVDDLTFSGGVHVVKLRRLFQRIVAEEGFQLKSDKTRTMLASERQTVTNLVVNKKVNLAREDRSAIKKEIMQMLASGRPLTPSLSGKLHWFRSVNREVGTRLLNRTEKASYLDH